MFIVRKDFYTVYTEENFDKLIASNDSIWEEQLPRTLEDIKSYLRARYDVEAIFADITIVDADAGVTSTKRDRIYQSTSAKHYYCIQDASSQDLTTTAYFENRDDRNAKIVEITIDMILYNLIPRLNNIDIPKIRNERYDGNRNNVKMGAIGWLNDVNKGKLQPDLPLRIEGELDKTGNIVMYGDAAQIKAKNSAF